jgi:chemotaxis protein methyltransferase WspC
VVFARIAALLKERMGLDPESIGVASVERAVRARCGARGLDDEQLYWEQLIASEQELQELIEAIVIPETWFFRDPEAFTALVRMLLEEWLPKHAEGTLRMLSLPCSTGEEPFSMAMALLDGGFPAQRFHIDAIDISLRAIAHAERGVYGKNSFRAKDLGFRDRYFESLERGFRLSDAVRRQVHFRHGNLLASGWLHGAHGYNAIFCRNVLIYFDRPMQNRAIEVLATLLAPGGLLFVGPSETGLTIDHGFVSAGIPLSFAFRRAEAITSQPGPTRKILRVGIPAKPIDTSRPRTCATAVQPRPKREATLEATPKDKAPTGSGRWIEEARRLANQGKLNEALKLCEQNLRDQPASAEAFYMIGMLHDAAGEVRKAAEHYRKALYLDPQHHEALVHLAVALQKEGDARGAQRLFDRANRQSAAGAGKIGG